MKLYSRESPTLTRKMTLHCADEYDDIKSVIDLYEQLQEQGISFEDAEFEVAEFLTKKKNALNVVKFLVNVINSPFWSVGHLDIAHLKSDADVSLHFACLVGWLDKVKTIVAGEVCNINTKNSYGDTPLSLAASNRYKDIVDFLIQSGADIKKCSINVTNLKCPGHNCSWTVLHIACYLGWLDIVKTIVKINQVFDLDVKTSEGYSPLYIAAICGDHDMVEFLIQSGVDIKCPVNDSNWTILHAACHLRWLDIVKIIVERNHGFDLDVKTSKGYTPLSIAAKCGDHDMIEFLIQSGADVNCFANDTNWTVLHFACQIGWFDIVKIIVEKNGDYDLEVKTIDGYTPMLLAASYEHKDIVNLLLKFDADVNAYDAEKMTILHYACVRGWTDVVTKCIQACSDVNAKTVNGIVPLHLAYQTLEIEIIKLLLVAGADVNIKDNKNCTPLEVSLFDHYFLCLNSKCLICDIIRLLIKHGAFLDDLGYMIICKNKDLRKCVLEDVNMSTRVVINNYNNVDLPAIFRIPRSVKLPSVNNLKLNALQSAACEIEKFVVNEIKIKGFCNVMEVCPPVLQMLSVRSLAKYYN